jgi:hypothetical protein
MLKKPICELSHSRRRSIFAYCPVMTFRKILGLSVEIPEPGFFLTQKVFGRLLRRGNQKIAGAVAICKNMPETIARKSDHLTGLPDFLDTIYQNG